MLNLYIQKISFENYRNLKNNLFIPSQGINVIYGDNAQGKTNLIEAIWLFTGGRSFRGARDQELVAFGKKYAKLTLKFYAGEREQSMELLIGGGKRSAVLNDVPKSALSQIIGSFCCVVFSPDHLTLVKNGPEERRSFIDAALCQIKPSYAHHLSRYKRILNERNALLKDIPRHRELEDMIDIWDERLCSVGAVVAMERYQYTNKLSELAHSFYDGISSGKEALALSYKTGCDCESMNYEEIREKLMTSLKKRQTDDIYCGYTTVGVHRDDLNIRINGKEARSFGSQGQQRSVVLSMKLAEAALLGTEKNEQPVILLDDVLSELDHSRQQYLLKKLSGMQVFITCCEKEIDAENKVRIQNGSISAMEE